MVVGQILGGQQGGYALFGKLAVEELGYGWCFGRWYGPYGVAFCIPAIEASTYEQVEDYSYYIDQGMMGLFQKLNGVQ